MRRLTNTQLLMILGSLIVILLFVVIFTTPKDGRRLIDQAQGELVPIPNETYNVVTPSDEQKIKNEQHVSILINKLPHKGRYFTLVYDFTTLDFVATMDINNKDAANRELDQYLKTNNIEHRDWLKYLVIDYK